MVSPGEVVVEDDAPEVQNAGQISTMVTARAGRIVASELQTYVGSSSGLALVPGVTHAQNRWVIPQAEEVSGGDLLHRCLQPGLQRPKR